jgi:hypothetical protein
MSMNFGEQRVADIRDDENIATDLSELTGLPKGAIHARLSDAHGAKTLRKLFDDVWPSTADRLGSCTVAFAKRYALNDELQSVTGATGHLVTRRLNQGPGPANRASVHQERSARGPGRQQRAPEPDAEALADPTDDGGIEDETTGSDLITRPFDPNKIRVKLWTPTVDLVLKRIDENEIDLAPDFQRAAGIWKDRAQSRLIESLLIRIPLPAFYFDAGDEDHLLVIDGIQRLTAIRRFVLEKELALEGLEYLTELEGKTWEQLPRPFQRRIDETMLTVHLIDKGTPEEAKLNIFKRLNTGGSPLTLQEIRHAMNPGPVRDYLRDLAALPSFITATQKRFSDDRMTDRECALRFCAFFLKAPAEYPVQGDLDNFLQETMRTINKMPEEDRAEMAARFDRSLEAAHRVLGNEAFRKPTRNNRRAPVNKALFEAWTVGFDNRSDREIERLVTAREDVRAAFRERFDKSRDLQEALSQGTGDPRKVLLRFSAINDLLKGVIS